MSSEEYTDYWYEYTRYICFPNTPDTYRKIGNFYFYTTVPDLNFPKLYEFWYSYDGADKELADGFNKVLIAKRSYHAHLSKNKTKKVDGKEFAYHITVNFDKHKTAPEYIGSKDLVRSLEWSLIESQKGYNRFQTNKTTNKEFLEFCKLLDKDGKHYRKIRKTKFQEKFGKTIEEFLAEKELEKEQQKDIVYTTLVGEAYSKLEKLRDECNIIMKGLQDGRKGYELDTYKAFRNEILSWNQYLGYRNEFIKNQMKHGALRRQTLLMFLRDNAKRPEKTKK